MKTINLILNKKAVNAITNKLKLVKNACSVSFTEDKKEIKFYINKELILTKGK